VCWHFRLLPRWALAVLAARELLMLVFGRYGQRRGVELRINWPGRVAVFPLMAALFFAITGLEDLAEILLYVGLVLAITATVMYLRYGLAEMRRKPRP